MMMNESMVSFISPVDGSVKIIKGTVERLYGKIIIEERDMGLYIIDFKDVRWVVPLKGEVDRDEYGVNWGSKVEFD